jgi:peptidyl-Lys metalloendopeptidase
MNKKVNLALCVLLLMTLLITVTTAGAASKDTPKITLSTQQSEFSASEDVVLSVTISNESNHSLRMLKWFTPADGIVEPVFVVVANGEPVQYTGALYKRLAPTGNDYLTLKSGESVTFDVNLGEYYDLSVSAITKSTTSLPLPIFSPEKDNNGASLDVSNQPLCIESGRPRTDTENLVTPYAHTPALWNSL